MYLLKPVFTQNNTFFGKVSSLIEGIFSSRKNPALKLVDIFVKEKYTLDYALKVCSSSGLSFRVEKPKESLSLSLYSNKNASVTRQGIEKEYQGYKIEYDLKSGKFLTRCKNIVYNSLTFDIATFSVLTFSSEKQVKLFLDDLLCQAKTDNKIANFIDKNPSIGMRGKE